MSHNQTTRLLILIQAILLTAFGLILKSMEDNFGDMLIGSGIAIIIVLSIRFCFKSLHSISRKKQVFRLK